MREKEQLVFVAENRDFFDHLERVTKYAQDAHDNFVKAVHDGWCPACDR